MKIRGFEKISKYAQLDFQMPERKTRYSAGYDICVPEEIILPPHKLVMVPTGLKAYMLEDEYLGIHIRSSMAVKKHLRLVNNEGIIDCDYYNNTDNEGHIMLAIMNEGEQAILLPKNERIAQGIFYKYLTIDGDVSQVKSVRGGGFGSTDV